MIYLVTAGLRIALHPLTKSVSATIEKIRSHTKRESWEGKYWKSEETGHTENLVLKERGRVNYANRLLSNAKNPDFKVRSSLGSMAFGLV